VIKLLIAIRETTHTTHDAENVVVGGIDAYLGSLGSLNCGVTENKLEGSVINTGEVAGTGRLVLLRAKGERVDVDALIGVACVGLVRLDPREVRSFTLREAILAVKLELSSDDGVLAPAVKVEGGLSKDEGASIRNCGTSVVVREIGRSRLAWDNVSIFRGLTDSVRSVGVGRVGVIPGENLGTAEVGLEVGVTGAVPVAGEVGRDVSIKSASILEKTTSVNVGVRVSSNLVGSTESVNGVGKSIDSIGVVEGLGAKNFEKGGVAGKR